MIWINNDIQDDKIYKLIEITTLLISKNYVDLHYSRENILIPLILKFQLWYAMKKTNWKLSQLLRATEHIPKWKTWHFKGPNNSHQNSVYYGNKS